MALIYSAVILIATVIGSTAGLGGGVIIKPILDLIGYHDITTISFISTSAVFSMALYSVVKQMKSGIKIDWLLVSFVSIGAMFGGNLGNLLFLKAITVFLESTVSIVQAIILSSLLILTILSMKMKQTYVIKTPLVYIFVGLCLGTISSFLGIGGGPINVAIFVFFFSIEIKKAVVYSLATILFSQGSKLITIGMTTGFMVYDISILLYVIPVAIVGGIIGSYFNKKCKEQTIKRVFNGSVITIIVINLLVIINNYI